MKKSDLSVGPFVRITDMDSDQDIYIQKPIVMSFYLLKPPKFTDIGGPGYQPKYGTSFWREFLTKDYYIEREMDFGRQAKHRIVCFDQSQQLDAGIYSKLCFLCHCPLEWNRFFSIQKEANYEFRVFTGELTGNIIMNCLFTNKEKAAKFVLPVWAADALEITGKARYSDYSLVRRGFPKLKELKIS